MSSSAVPPSGRQVELVSGDHRAVVVSVGGGIRRYEVGGRALFDGYAEDAMADGARGQLLVPWPNRVKDGAWSWRGRQLQLALTEPEQHNAIHGLVRWAGWRVAETTGDTAVFECDVWPQQGWPWALGVRVEHRLRADGLTVTTSVTNRSDAEAPVAAGAHPYVTAGTASVDDATLHLPADTWLPTGDQQIPTGEQPVDGTPYDFRDPRRIGDLHIDYAFTGLHRDEQGRFELTLTADDGTGVAFWVGPEFPYVEIYTGDTLPDESRRRQGLGVEPMTAPPNALASGTSLVVLAPGGTWSGSWGIRPI